MLGRGKKTMIPFSPLLQEDLQHVLAHARPALESMAGSRWFVTGGTGFFGKWLLECICAANDVINSEISAVILSRNVEHFKKRMPHLAARTELSWLSGDVTDFRFPSGKFNYVAHMATSTSTYLNQANPRAVIDTIVRGTDRVLAFSEQSGVQHLLLTSSGAVYGPQPPTLDHIGENYGGGPDVLSPGAAYAEGKRIAELLCASSSISCTIARCFAFIGPHLPLDTHFAAGNFLRDALNGKPIMVHGDGLTIRSYLYAADLTIWLLALQAFGEAGRAYNVGSDEPISIRGLAERIGAQGFTTEIRLLGESDGKPNRYVPDVSRIANELGQRQTITIDDAVRRTLNWHKVKPVG